MGTNDQRARITPKKLILSLLLGIPLWGAIAWYFFADAGGNRALVNAYVAAAKSGQAVQPLEPDAHSDAARALVAKSRSWSLRNWASTTGDGQGSGCVWTRVTDAAERGTDVAFFVVRRGESWHIARVSADQECHCAKHHPCKMDP
jgi:hypothetical protein